jgi:hypothetical protein
MSTPAVSYRLMYGQDMLVWNLPPADGVWIDIAPGEIHCYWSTMLGYYMITYYPKTREVNPLDIDVIREDGKTDAVQYFHPEPITVNISDIDSDEPVEASEQVWCRLVELFDGVRPTQIAGLRQVWFRQDGEHTYPDAIMLVYE